MYRSRLFDGVSRHTSQKASEAEKDLGDQVVRLKFTSLMTAIARRYTSHMKGHDAVAVKPKPPLTPQTRSAHFAVPERIADCTFIFALTKNDALFGAFDRPLSHEDIKGSVQCEIAMPFHSVASEHAWRASINTADNDVLLSIFRRR